MDSASVAAIFIYPIKSLDPVAVPEARILPSGALEHDREFALFDQHGTVINAKRTARIHHLRATYALEKLSVTLQRPGIPEPQTFNLVEHKRELETWLGDFLGLTLTLQRNVETGFPDDLEAPGPTVVSSQTLREVGSWFGISDEEQVRRRFRPNIELTAESAFWEDRLFAREGQTVPFSVGNILFYGVNPCQRCVVPSRNPETGEVLVDFQREFSRRRAATLPDGVEQSRFTHYYRLTVNTRIPHSEAGKTLRVGDHVELGAHQSTGSASSQEKDLSQAETT